MQIRRGPAAVIGQVPGRSGHCHEAGRPSGVVTSREPEDLPVEFLLRCSGRGHPSESPRRLPAQGTRRTGRRILPCPPGRKVNLGRIPLAGPPDITRLRDIGKYPLVYQARIFAINAGALVGLVALQRLGIAIELASSTQLPIPTLVRSI